MVEEKELQKSIDKLNETQEKLASVRWNFVRGIVYGLGFFIGGTLIVSFILYLISYFTSLI